MSFHGLSLKAVVYKQMFEVLIESLSPAIAMPDYKIPKTQNCK